MIDGPQKLHPGVVAAVKFVDAILDTHVILLQREYTVMQLG